MKNHAFSSPSLPWLRSPLALLLLLAVAGALLFSAAPAVQAQTADSTGTAGSSITVVIETIPVGKRATVSWTDGGTCATTSSYNVYGYFASTDSTAFVNLMETPVAGTNSYSISKRFTSFGADELQLWCGTPASGRLVAKVAGLNAGTPGTYTHSVPADAALSALTLSLTDTDSTPVELTPAFGPDVTEYTAMALSETVVVTPTARNSSATFAVKVGGVGNHPNNELPLAEGANTVTVEVTAADGARDDADLHRHRDPPGRGVVHHRHRGQQQPGQRVHLCRGRERHGVDDRRRRRTLHLPQRRVPGLYGRLRHAVP